MNPENETVKALNCFCGGGVRVCASYENSYCYWRVHCQDCDWSYGGSSLCEYRNPVVLEWNRQVSIRLAVAELIKFGHPREGSLRYHTAWENLAALTSPSKKKEK